jgi:ribonucleotide monophosphatase NagD (HAD superfamily)
MTAAKRVLLDIGGARNAGLRADLVQTGKYNEQDIRASAIEPDHLIALVASLPDLLRFTSQSLR